jgi:hypothetical protein
MLPNRIPPESDETRLFTEEEYAKAMSFITDNNEARRYAHRLVQPDEEPRAWSLSPDLLDLLSLVSDDCAARVAVVLKLSPEDAKARREGVARQLGRKL